MMAIKMAESLRYGYYVLSVGKMCIFLNYIFTGHSVPGRQVVKINKCTTMYLINKHVSRWLKEFSKMIMSNLFATVHSLLEGFTFQGHPHDHEVSNAILSHASEICFLLFVVD